MTANGWFQFVFYVVILVAITPPLGIYLGKVLDPSARTFLDLPLKPIERLFYWLFRIDPQREQTWLQYGVSMLIFSFVSLVFTFLILWGQPHLPWYSNLPRLSDQTPMTPSLAFDTAASFTTNTNWQNYGGENTMSYFSQMVGLASHNFWSAAIGIAIAAVLVRGLARDRAKTIGNFWADLVRINLYLLIPICIVYALFLVSQGSIMNFHPYKTVPTLENASSTQIIPMGPVASQMAIKMLGTNGGGYFNANACFTYENPTPLSNFIQILSIFAIPSALTFYLGRMVKSPAHGWAVWASMFVLFAAGFVTCYWAEARGNPIIHHMGISSAGGNMEGKEVRFGIPQTTLFATITTDASCGAVDGMHDSFTAIGGMVPLINIQLGEVVFGGVGAGLYGMLVFVVIAIFIAGLMVGRTPEYLGKKIESFDVKMASLAVLILIFDILGFTGWSCVSPWGGGTPAAIPGANATQLGNIGPHGLTELLYAFTSNTGNNGSAFAGLNGNTTWLNTTLGLSCLLGRFIMLVPIMAMAGSLGRKKIIPASAGTFPVTGPTFVILLVGTILIVGALTFFPALSLGPIVEHFLMNAGRTF
ncbi:MAG TPA: potassium-transporting ATPase subunit KdpA [Tepidisphaeraceae bacterium]|nr:potassium-transporting ATPase subunit KdpA [Tepidisphaeraceae bacterium]